MKTVPSLLSGTAALIVAAAFAAGGSALHAAEEAPVDAATIIARARDHLGGDAALDAIKSLRFKGHVAAPEGKSHAIEIFARRPMQQLIIETSDDVRVVTGLDNYDGWRKDGPLDRPEAGRIMLMSAPEIRRIRASTWQVLYYYHDIAAVGGSITVEGVEDVDGVKCARTVFSHPGAVTFVRFFDVATGRLVLTKTDDGAELRESGEIVVDGVHFPKELSTTVAGETSRVTFDEVAINEDYPDDRFKMPMPKVNFGPPPSPTLESPPQRAPAPTPTEATPPAPNP